MKKTVIGSAIVLATAIGLLSSLRQSAVGCYRASQGTSIEINTESALIVWDAEDKVEHFIRKATFNTAADHFGFLVPTPTKPELTDAKDAIFSRLDSITAPVAKPGYALRRSRYNLRGAYSAGSTVAVLEIKQVAGFDAAILAATDVKGLSQWLQKHGYQSGADFDNWLQPYVDQRWIITAFKIAKSEPKVRTVGSTLVRMSFHTDRPFFPYREPPPKPEKPLVAEEVIARQPAEAQRILRTLIARSKEQQRLLNARRWNYRPRTLRVYFLADRAVKGHLGNTGYWNGRTVYSKQLSDQHRRELLGLMAINSYQPPFTLSLTEFLDGSVVREGNTDVFFSPLETTSPLGQQDRLAASAALPDQTQSEEPLQPAK